MIAAQHAVKTARIVDADQPLSADAWRAELAAAQAWWREAGVDLAFADEPTQWLAAATPGAGAELQAPGSSPARPQPAAPAPPPRLGGDRARWPATLEDFAGWWLSEASLDPAPAARRVPPAGPRGAALMILVPAPEEGDGATLLSGRQGRLLDAILAAFGHAREAVYLASVVPAPIPHVDCAGLAADGMAEVLAHHIALAAPQRLMVFGRDVSPLLGHGPAQATQSSLRFNHEDTSIPLAFAPSLEALLEKPALKRGVWRRWLEWTGT